VGRSPEKWLFMLILHVDRKKQLVYRISAWGFEKNIKKSERREIVERLGSELENSDVAVHLRGRLFDKAKLNRWRRRDKVDGDDLLARTEGMKEDILLGNLATYSQVNLAYLTRMQGLPGMDQKLETKIWRSTICLMCSIVSYQKKPWERYAK
jgi:hypothetical protein